MSPFPDSNDLFYERVAHISELIRQHMYLVKSSWSDSKSNLMGCLGVCLADEAVS
jgi:hypothetical protein